MGNKENIILNDRDEQIGFYKDLRAGLEWSVGEFVKTQDYEQAQDTCELLGELESYAECGELLVLSENNGMGYTIRKYADTLKIAS